MFSRTIPVARSSKKTPRGSRIWQGNVNPMAGPPRLVRQGSESVLMVEVMIAYPNVRTGRLRHQFQPSSFLSCRVAEDVVLIASK